MKKILTIVNVFGVMLTTSVVVNAAVPDLVPVQGTVDDGDGAPIDGPTDMTFEIYDAIKDGNLLYQSVYDKTTMQVNVDQGFFTVYLGELDAYPLEFADLSSASQLWLQIVVNNEALDSRIRLASVLFAHHAETCEQVGDLSDTDIQKTIGEACEEGQFLRGWDDDADKPICGADQIGENTSAVTNWDEMINIPDGFSDNKDDGFTSEGQLTALLDDNYVGKSQADSITSGMITDGTIGAADVNSSAVQIRGSKTKCDSGQYMSGVGEDGNVSCEEDQKTESSYNAGTGLNLDGTTFNVNPADLFAVPVHAAAFSGAALGKGNDVDLVKATINLKTPGWVIAMGMANLAVTENSGGVSSYLCISVSSAGSCVEDSLTSMRPQVTADPGAGYYQQSSQALIYYETAGQKSVYMIGHSDEDDTVKAYSRNLTLFSIPAAQND